MLVGAHVSIQGGVEKAPERGHRIGAEVIQIFSKNQQQWAAPPLSEESARLFRENLGKWGLGPTLIHTSYLLNLSSPDDTLWKKSTDALVLEVERAHLLGVPRVVFHPGSPKTEERSWGIRRVGEALRNVLDRTSSSSVRILLETNAGAGNALGRTFEELRAMLREGGDSKRLEICIDTCHLFVSGYDVRTAEGLEKTLKEAEEHVGLDRVGAFHLNDSQGGLGSNRDRHESIGKGEMGEVVFQTLLRDPRFESIPGYIETPYESDDDYVRDLTRLKELRKGARPRPPPGPNSLPGLPPSKPPTRRNPTPSRRRR